mgnify:FL=1|jgi:hypothetical protein|tara:strand:+ start:6573 stop:7553 length:981 start_codon:yes stop_codon:yes gene_type:complete
MAEDKKNFVADDGISSVPSAVTPEGGEGKKDKLKKTAEDKPETSPTADGKKIVPGQTDAGKPVPTAEEIETVEEIVIESSIQSIIEGEDLSEEFKGKIALVFEAALSEEVAKRTLSIKEQLETAIEANLAEAVETRMGEIVENVDKYLDYVVSEWTKENEIAIESGIKVEMAESLMGGLRSLFTEHNITVEEDAVDVVSTLETKVSDLEVSANELVSENIDLQREISSFKAGKIFDGLSEGLSDNQVERLKVLSEKLDVEDLESYSENLQVIKESFFSDKPLTESQGDVQEESDEIILEEQEVSKPTSDYTSINALVEAFNTRKNN